MKIGGLQKFSLLDYPGHLSAIVFTQGCNFRCQFCYNPMLVTPSGAQSRALNSPDSLSGGEVKEASQRISEDGLFDFLKERQRKLDAVVITGGEPTLHRDLPQFIRRIKEKGFKVKLDTNGTNPLMLGDIVSEKTVDYLAMDIKAAPLKYDLVAGVQPDLANIEKSVKIIKGSGLPYEFRTTIVPELIATEDIAAMGEMIKGAKKWYLQQFVSNTDLVNKRFQGFAPYSRAVLDEMREIARQYVKFCEIR